MTPKRYDAFAFIVIVLIILAICSAIWQWYIPEPIPDPTHFTIQPPIKKTDTIERVDIPIKKVVTLKKKDVIKVIKAIPEEIKQDDTKEITATAVTPCPEGTSIEAISIIDTNTGATTILTKPTKPSLFAFENKQEIGVRVGSNQQIDVFARWQFVRVGSIHLGVYGEINPKEGKGAIELVYKP